MFEIGDLVMFTIGSARFLKSTAETYKSPGLVVQIFGPEPWSQMKPTFGVVWSDGTRTVEHGSYLMYPLTKKREV